MDLKDYFENTKGIGILSTADSEGNVDSALYARPHIMEDTTLALIMHDRLSHANLQSNPKAAYLFLEDGQEYEGKRFFLTKVKEEQDPEKIESLRRRSYAPDDPMQKKDVFLVYFQIDQELPLIGSGK